MKFSACLALLCLSAPAWALRINPTIATLGTHGPEATRVLELENETGHEARLKIEAQVDAIDIDGDETTIPVRSLRVEPTRLNLAPHQKRAVRLSWAGDPNLGKELAFRIVASESGTGKRAPGIDLAPVTLYEAAAYVAPRGAAPAVAVNSLRVLPDGKGELVLSNQGTAHQPLTGLHLRVKRDLEGGREESIDFHPREPKELDADNLPPTSVRRFVIDLPKKLAAIPGPLHAEVAFAKPGP